MDTFREHAASYLKSAHVRESTREKYRQVLGLANDVLGDLSLGEIQSKHLEELDAAARARGLALSTRRRLATVARSVVRPHHVLPPLRLRAEDGRPRTCARALSAEEHRLLLQALPDGEGYSDALQVLLLTGLRLGELLALRATDWDVDAATLRVERSTNGATKSGRSRVVDVPDSAIPVLVRRAQGGGDMFPLCERGLRRALARACDAAGVQPCRVHDLRHTRITQLMLGGAPVLYVSSQAGHASPAFTMERYGHLAIADPAARRAWANC